MRWLVCLTATEGVDGAMMKAKFMAVEGGNDYVKGNSQVDGLSYVHGLFFYVFFFWLGFECVNVIFGFESKNIVDEFLSLILILVLILGCISSCVSYGGYVTQVFKMVFGHRVYA